MLGPPPSDLSGAFFDIGNNVRRYCRDEWQVNVSLLFEVPAAIRYLDARVKLGIQDGGDIWWPKYVRCVDVKTFQTTLAIPKIAMYRRNPKTVVLYWKMWEVTTRLLFVSLDSVEEVRRFRYQDFYTRDSREVPANALF